MTWLLFAFSVRRQSVAVLPNWKEQPTRPSLTGKQWR